MSNLAQQYISQSYQSVVNVGTGSGAYLTSTLQPLTDGFGTSLPINVSNNTVELVGNVSITGSLVSSIIPAVSNSVDLGTPTKPFRHIYAGSGSFYMDGNQILSLQNNGANTSLAAPSGGTLNLINNIVFDSNNTNLYGSSITYVGKGPNNQTQHYYTGSDHFINTNGNFVIQNFISGAAPSSGAITLNAVNNGSLNLLGSGGVNMQSGDFISLQATGSVFLSGSLLGLNGNTVYASYPYNFSHPNTLQLAGNTYDTAQYLWLQGQDSYIFGYGVTSSYLAVGSVDAQNGTYDTEVQIYATPSQVHFQDFNTATNDYSDWMTLIANDGSNPSPVFTRGLQVTGTFYADQIDVSRGGIVETTGSYIGTFTNDGVLAYDNYQNVGQALSPYITASFNTSSLATTGSNNFKGNQTISGSLSVSGTTYPIGGISFVGSNIANTTGSNILTLQSGSNIVSYASYSQIASAMGVITTGSLSTEQQLSSRLTIYGNNGGVTPRLFVSGSDNAKTEIGRNFVGIDSTAVAGFGGNFNVYGDDTSTVGFAAGVYTPDTFENDYEFQIITSTGGTHLQDFDNFNAFDYEDFMFIPPNNGDSPAPVMTRGLTISGSLTVNGNKQFNVGAFQSNQTQSGSANVSQSITYNATDYSQGVTYESGSHLKIANSGVYNIQFSAQIDRVSGSGTDTAYIWLKKNGSNVTNSAGAITITGGALAAKTVSSWNYVVEAAANDYFELVWQSTNNNVQLINVTSSGNIPGIPSIIVTVTQVR
jgi:hypothetical protein